MSAKKHTPGPWRIIRVSEYTDDPEDTAISSIDGPGGETILFTDSGYFKPLEANAALIAAAPDLLAALENILIWWEDMEADNNFTFERDDLSGSARAAIAKAKGA